MMTEAPARAPDALGVTEETPLERIDEQLKQETALHIINIFWQLVFNLTTPNDTPSNLDGDICDEEKMLPIYQDANDGFSIYNLYMSKLILCYLFHDYAESVKNGEMAKKHLIETI